MVRGNFQSGRIGAPCSMANRRSAAQLGGSRRHPRERDATECWERRSCAANLRPNGCDSATPPEPSMAPAPTPSVPSPTWSPWPTWRRQSEPRTTMAELLERWFAISAPSWAATTMCVILGVEEGEASVGDRFPVGRRGGRALTRASRVRHRRSATRTAPPKRCRLPDGSATVRAVARDRAPLARPRRRPHRSPSSAASLGPPPRDRASRSNQEQPASPATAGPSNRPTCSPNDAAPPASPTSRSTAINPAASVCSPSSPTPPRDVPEHPMCEDRPSSSWVGDCPWAGRCGRRGRRSGLRPSDAARRPGWGVSW